MPFKSSESVCSTGSSSQKIRYQFCFQSWNECLGMINFLILYINKPVYFLVTFCTHLPIICMYTWICFISLKPASITYFWQIRCFIYCHTNQHLSISVVSTDERTDLEEKIELPWPATELIIVVIYLLSNDNFLLPDYL